jgi:hypothetical protein
MVPLDSVLTVSTGLYLSIIVHFNYHIPKDLRIETKDDSRKTFNACSALYGNKFSVTPGLPACSTIPEELWPPFTI